MKFMVTADLDWIQGYLRYGHLEGVVEVESEDELNELIESGDIVDYLSVVVDDYRVEDWDDPERFEYSEIE